MTAITLRNIPSKLEELIRKRADRDGLSLNRTVLRMLEEVAGHRPPARVPVDDLDALAGTWSRDEAVAFDAALADQRRIDPDVWR
jgi:hypothetical protein